MTGLDFNTAPLQGDGERVYTPANDRGEFDRRVAGLREALRKSAKTVFEALFPHGEINAREGRIGDVRGEHGESLKCDFNGNGAGIWFDHATGDGGDLIALYQAFWACSFPEAVEGLEGLVGISYAEPAQAWVKRTRERASIQKAAAGPKPRKVRACHWDYLSRDGSAILARVVRFDKFDALSGLPVMKNGKQAKTFGLATVGSDGREDWAGPEVRPLFNLPALAGLENGSAVAFVEGEKCAERLAKLGVPATCMIGGANGDLEKVDWAIVREKRLRLIQWGDLDAAGVEFMRRVQAKLPGTPCVLVDVPAAWEKPAKWDAANATDDEALDLLKAAYAALDALPVAANVGSRFRLLTVEQLENAKPPEWLVDGMIPEASYAAIVGDAGTMKSFAALGWGLCVAHGVPWLGRSVKQGPVVYVAGEGQSGVAGRVIAWEAAQGLRGVRAPFYVLPSPVDMLSGEVDELLAALATLAEPPALVILDTLARTFGAGDENSQQDMNAFNGGVGRVQAATGACVLVVHHTGKSGDVRGSSALRGAVDVMMTMDRADRRLILGNGGKIGKMKDAEAFEDLAMTYHVQHFERADGEAGSSVVLILGEPAEPAEGEGDSEPRRQRLASPAKLPDLEKAALKLAKAAEGRGLGMTAFTATLKGSRSGVWKAVKSLADKGLLEVVHGEGDQVLYAFHEEPG